jgi:hypothetical protein
MLRWRLCSFCVAWFCLTAIGVRPATAQIFTPPQSTDRFNTAAGMGAIEAARMDGMPLRLGLVIDSSNSVTAGGGREVSEDRADR